MNDNNMEQDREVRREEIEQRRNEQRCNVQDENRRVNVPDSEVQEKVYKLANNLKSKSAITEEDLQSLHSLMTADSTHINTFLKVNGSLRGLVGELTGSCVNKQLWSASILCLVTAAAPRVASRAAAYYLVLTLDFFTEQLTVYGAYCLGNLATDINVCKVLVEQGALTKLLEMLQKPVAQHVKKAVLSAVIRFVSSLKDNMSMEHLTSCMLAVPKLDFNNIEAARCLSLVSCHTNYIQRADPNYALIVADLFVDLLELHINNCKFEKDCSAVYMARVIANTSLNAYNSNTILSLMLSRYAFVYLARILCSPNHLQEACNWALGNIFVYSNHDQMKVSFHQEMMMLMKQR